MVMAQPARKKIKKEKEPVVVEDTQPHAPIVLDSDSVPIPESPEVVAPSPKKEKKRVSDYQMQFIHILFLFASVLRLCIIFRASQPMGVDVNPLLLRHIQ